MDGAIIEFVALYPKRYCVITSIRGARGRSTAAADRHGARGFAGLTKKRPAHDAGLCRAVMAAESARGDAIRPDGGKRVLERQELAAEQFLILTLLGIGNAGHARVEQGIAQHQ